MPNFQSIASSTSHILLLKGIPEFTPAFISQKNEAIRLINEELSIPNILPSDTVILAVTAMVLIEVIRLPEELPAEC